MKKFTVKYIEREDKVQISWKGLRVLGVMNASQLYNVDSPDFLKKVLNDYKQEANEIVNDYL